MRTRISAARLRGIDVVSVKGRANIPALLDSAYPYAHLGDWGNLKPPAKESKRTMTGIGYLALNRHNEHTNSLFLDWSVRRIGIKELWTLKWHLQFDTANVWTRAGGVLPEDWPEWMRGFKDY